ncbi:MAG: universal stress protein [Coriobacteriia bacterium]|nr:universal stress protein [Coriobacteriia bacterium]
MDMQRVMVPYDGSDPSIRAFKVAYKIALDAPSVELHVVRIVPAEDIPMWLDSSDSFMGTAQFQLYNAQQYRDIMESLQQKARAEMEDVVSEAEQELGNRMVVRAIARQNVANGIAEYVDDNDCHIVIMGSRGLGGVRGILGSVSYSVLHQLEVPVMIVK